MCAAFGTAIRARLKCSNSSARASATVIDPDGPGPIWEVPIANPRNIDCTHYPQPQTGVAYTASAGEC